MRRGFTLLEVAVVVAIIGIVVAFAGVSFTVLHTQRLESDALRMYSELVWARTEAINKNSDYSVSFDLSNESYSIYEGTPSGGTLKKSISLISDLLLVEYADDGGNMQDLSPSEVMFNAPFGKATRTDTGRSSFNSNVMANDYVKITLTHEGESRKIFIYGETGFIDIEE